MKQAGQLALRPAAGWNVTLAYRSAPPAPAPSPQKAEGALDMALGLPRVQVPEAGRAAVSC